uniref:Uncharacterized protein n=1 Tax=Fagus sylvatica TaxID=28930 RepID=A0A2N9HMK7_FAGSY
MGCSGRRIFFFFKVRGVDVSVETVGIRVERGLATLVLLLLLFVLEVRGFLEVFFFFRSERS